MTTPQSTQSEVTIHAEDIGGIEKTTVSFYPGVTILVGRNATNRTSFLESIMAAVGSKNVSVKGDANEGRVQLTIGDETYNQRVIRKPDGIATDSNPYLEDPMLADLFAFLLESNEARRAVASGDNLRDIIMRPIDTEEIESEKNQLIQKRESLQRELDEIDEQKGKLPELEEKRTQLQTQIDEKRTKLDTKEKEIEVIDTDIEEKREAKATLEEKLTDLKSKRSDLDDLRYDLETERESLETLKRERKQLESEADQLPEASEEEVRRLESEINRLRERKQLLETDVNELQSVLGFNEEVLEDTDNTPFEILNTDSSAEVTEQLLPDGEVTCWTCGSKVEAEQIEETIDRLRELSQSKIRKVNDIEGEIQELTEEKRGLEQSQQDHKRIEQRLTEVENEIDQGQDTIDQLQAKRNNLTDEIENIEAEIEELKDEDYSDILDLHKEANQLEYELGSLENDLDRVESEIVRIEDRIEDRSDVKTQLDKAKAEIDNLRTKIERIEHTTIEQFNDHMDTVLEILNYSNLDRIWLERVKRDAREGRRKVTTTVFELHVVRSTTSGVAYEDTIQHLSESELEVTGLIFALAGFLAHDVYEKVPFMLLDSLEAIDSERIATLIDYLREYTDYLLVVLLPEDAASLPEKYERITEI